MAGTTGLFRRCRYTLTLSAATVIILTAAVSGVGCREQEPTNIYWNSSNPAFSSRRPASTIQVNGDTTRSSWQFDQVNLVCPSGPGVTEQHIIYSVSQGRIVNLYG